MLTSHLFTRWTSVRMLLLDSPFDDTFDIAVILENLNLLIPILRHQLSHNFTLTITHFKQQLSTFSQQLFPHLRNPSEEFQAVLLVAGCNPRLVVLDLRLQCLE